MIIDVTRVVLYPGAGGEECLGNGKHRDAEGRLIECCCDECDYMQCCYEGCVENCTDKDCPRKQKSTEV